MLNTMQEQMNILSGIPYILAIGLMIGFSSTKKDQLAISPGTV